MKQKKDSPKTDSAKLYVSTIIAFKREQLRRVEANLEEPTYADLAAEAWQAYEREHGAVRIFTDKLQNSQSGISEITYSGELKTLASEIGERAAAILEIAEKVQVPHVGETIGIPETKLDTSSDLNAISTQSAADAARLSGRITRVEEQSGTTKAGRKRDYPKVSGG